MPESQIMGASSPLAVEVNLSEASLRTLADQGFELYAWKAVESSQGGGRPLIWWRPRRLTPRNTVRWGRRYQAFGSHSDIMPGRRIDPSFRAIDVGHTWFINDNLIGPVREEGASTAVSFSSTAVEPLSIGLSQPMADSFATSGNSAKSGNSATSDSFFTYCVFPLNPRFAAWITPREIVLLAFSTFPMAPGTVSGASLANPLGSNSEDSGADEEPSGNDGGAIRGSASPGLRVDLELAQVPEVTVSFDVLDGWTWGGFDWGRVVGTGESLTDLLILDS